MTKDYDVAVEWMAKSEQASNSQESHGETRDYAPVLRKIDLRIMPIICAIYFFQFIDKALLNYSAVMGIKDNLVDNEFANLGTIFNVAYIVGEPISGALIQRFPLAKTFSCFLTSWAIVLGCHAACHTYASLMVVRVLLGFFESSTVITLVSITGMYYTRSEQAKRIGIWASQAGTASMVGGLLSFAFQHINKPGFKSWQILFLVFGILTLVFAIVVVTFLPDNLTTAHFLDAEEKAMVIEHIRENQTGVENKKFKWYQVRELLFHDKLTWLMILLTITSQIVTGAVGTFSTTVVSTFGFSNKESALLQIPIGAIIIICCSTPTYLISKYGHFTLIHISMYIPSVVGAGMLFSQGKFVQLFGLYLLYPGSCAITLLYCWNGANTAGYTKRVFRSVLTMVAFGVANIIGPQLFQAYSYPSYHPAKITILVTQSVSIFLTALVGWLCWRENKTRTGDPHDYAFNDKTDIENRSFRYLW